MSARADGFEGSFLGDGARIGEDTALECGVCWWIYEPSVGDDVWQIAAGTPFTELPEHWRCPNCDAPRSGFMVLDRDVRSAPHERPARPAGAVDRDQRLAALLSAYEAVDERMRDLPVYNPALAIEAVGFRRWEEGLVGIVLTPWCMNLALLPGPDAKARVEGSTRELTLPSGRYAFIAGHLAGFGPIESCSLFSPMESFDDPAVARLVAEHAVRELFIAPKPPATAPAEPPVENVSRRSFLTGTASSP